MQYLATATALKPTADGHSAIVEMPRFILDSEIEDVTEENVFTKAREILGDPEHVKVMVMQYNPKKERV
jgi:hypothetical protein